MKPRIRQIAILATTLVAIYVLWRQVDSFDRPANSERATVQKTAFESPGGRARPGNDFPQRSPPQRPPSSSATESDLVPVTSQRDKSLPVLFEPSLDEASMRFATAKHEARIRWRSHAHRLVAQCSSTGGAGSYRAQRVSFTFVHDLKRSVPGTARFTAVEFAPLGDAETLSATARACLARVQGQSLDVALDSADVPEEEPTIDIYESFLLPVI